MALHLVFCTVVYVTVAFISFPLEQAKSTIIEAQSSLQMTRHDKSKVQSASNQ